MKRRRGKQAFTLLELVAATTILVMVVGATVVLLRSVLASRDRVQRQMELQQQARSCVDSLANSLHNAFRSSEQADLLLEGSDDWNGDLPADRIRFFTVSRRTVRDAQPESDVREVEFFLGDSAESAAPALVRRTDPTRNPQPDGGGVVERIADNCVALDISYHDGLAWQQEWPLSRKTWPVAVQVQLVVIGNVRGAIQPVTRLISFPRIPKTEGGGK